MKVFLGNNMGPMREEWIKNTLRLESIEIPDHVFVKSENQWLPVGATVTSDESGKLIMAGMNTPPEEIVGEVLPDGHLKTW